MKLLAAAAVSFSIIVGGSTGLADEAVADGMRPYVRALVDYWSGLQGGYVPLMVGEGQEVGDVVALDDHSVLERRAKCFPNLAKPASNRFEAPRYVGLDQSAASFLFQVKNLLGLSGNATKANNVVIFYTEATLDDLTPDDFASALSKDCEVLRPLIQNSRNVTIDGHQATLIRSIVRARANVAIAVDESAEAQAKIDNVKNLLPEKARSVVPFDAEAQARIGINGKRGIVVKGESVSAVAFRPTHIATSWFGGAEPKRSVIPFDPSDAAQRDLLARANRQWAENLPK